jgi:hypothetical protein
MQLQPTLLRLIFAALQDLGSEKLKRLIIETSSKRGISIKIKIISEAPSKA